MVNSFDVINLTPSEYHRQLLLHEGRQRLVEISDHERPRIVSSCALPIRRVRRAKEEIDADPAQLCLNVMKTSNQR